MFPTSPPTTAPSLGARLSAAGGWIGISRSRPRPTGCGRGLGRGGVGGLDGIRLQYPPHVVGDRGLLAEAVGAHEDMDDATLREDVPIPHDRDCGHHRWVAKRLPLKRDLELLGEA